jgi:hypothetical protein
MLARTNCEIWAYDFSVVDFGKQLTPEHRDRAHFMQVGIAGESKPTESPPYYSIQDLMKMNGHDYLYVPFPPPHPFSTPHTPIIPLPESSTILSTSSQLTFPFPP